MTAASSTGNTMTTNWTAWFEIADAPSHAARPAARDFSIDMNRVTKRRR